MLNEGKAPAPVPSPADYVEIIAMPEPAWLELWEKQGRRTVYLGQVHDMAAAKRYVQRYLPDRQFRLVLRAAGRPFLIFNLRPSFTGEPVMRIVFAAVLDRRT